MKVDNIKIIETGDFTFKVSFMYGSNNLETNALDNVSSIEEVKDAIKQTVTSWESKRALNNLTEIRKSFESKSLEIS